MRVPAVPTVRRAVSPLAILALLGGAAAADEPPAAPAQRESRGVYQRDFVDVAPSDGVDISLLTIDNRLGNVRIEGYDGKGVFIVAEKRAQDDDTLDRLRVSLVPDPSGAVRIGTALGAGEEMRPVAGGSVRIDLVVRAPRNARVEAQVWNGRLELIGMDNGAELSANEGDIKVERCSGDISTRNAFGQQDLADVFGAVDARGVTGEMRLSVVRGRRLDAMIHQGRIVGRRISSQQLSIRTTRGDIELDVDAVVGGRYQVRTYSGDVVVRMSATRPLTVRARAEEGKVELPEALRASHDAEGVLVGRLHRGKNPALLEVSSKVGSIRVQLAE